MTVRKLAAAAAFLAVVALALASLLIWAAAEAEDAKNDGWPL